MVLCACVHRHCSLTLVILIFSNLKGSHQIIELQNNAPLCVLKLKLLASLLSLPVFLSHIYKATLELNLSR
jgi:hypothetical protein